VAEELGVNPEIIQLEHADTGTTQFATPSGAGKTVLTESPAARAVAISLKRQLLDIADRDPAVEPETYTSGPAASYRETTRKRKLVLRSSPVSRCRGCRSALTIGVSSVD